MVKKSHDPFGHIPDNHYVNAKDVKGKVQVCVSPAYRKGWDRVFGKEKNNGREKNRPEDCQSRA